MELFIAKYTVRQTVYLQHMWLNKMISPIVQAAESLFLFFASVFTLPWTLWDKVKETIRSTVSLNGYTAINPDGVLDRGEQSKHEEKEEGEEEG